eukprot:scaffold199821_cov16-Tisochrysis_lutea.AAC.2
MTSQSVLSTVPLPTQAEYVCLTTGPSNSECYGACCVASLRRAIRCALVSRIGVLSPAGEVVLYDWVEWLKEEHSHLYQLPQQQQQQQGDQVQDGQEDGEQKCKGVERAGMRRDSDVWNEHRAGMRRRGGVWIEASTCACLLTQQTTTIALQALWLGGVFLLEFQKTNKESAVIEFWAAS